MKERRVTGNKKVELVPLKEILALTGYVRRVFSLAMKSSTTFLDSRALDFDFIVVSAGVRGLQLKLAP